MYLSVAQTCHGDMQQDVSKIVYKDLSRMLVLEEECLDDRETYLERDLVVMLCSCKRKKPTQ